jgi:ribokinase
MGRVLVVGSINADVVLEVARRPGPGETVLVQSSSLRHGGKGANQAVAAAATGADTTMLGAVGADEWGRAQVHALAAAGVDTQLITVADDDSTGFACITVTPEGENSIVVAPGANDRVSAQLVAAAATGAADVVVTQTEIPVAAVDRAAVLASAMGARFVLNTAPVVRVANETLASADPLVVNKHEAAQLLTLLGGSDGGNDQPSVEATARELRARSAARSLLVTLGPGGAMVLDDEVGEVHLSATRVEVVDTTGAGDVLVGTVAGVLARGADLRTAASAAISAATQAVTTPGARP